MKKFFTLISVALFAISANAQTEEEYLAVDDEGHYNTEFAAIVDADGKTANNVVNGNSLVTFGTTNVSVEGVSTGTPSDLPEGGQDLTIGSSIGENMYEYTVNSSKAIEWKRGNRGDLAYNWIQGTGVPAVSAYAEEIITDDTPTGKFRLAYVKFDPTIGGLPVTGLYYKITTNVKGALKIGIWANKGNHPTYLVDAESKHVSEFLVEGYINGQTWKQEDADAGLCPADQVGKMKFLNNDDIKAVHDAGNQTNPYVIGAGNQPFFGNLLVDTEANKTYYFFQGTTQIGFNGYTFYPGKSKEEIVTGIKAIQNIPTEDNVNAPVYNLAGQRVSAETKGLLIKNGKKFIVK